MDAVLAEAKCSKMTSCTTELGDITVSCTLDRHDGNEHYDDAFCITWKEHDES